MLLQFCLDWVSFGKNLENCLQQNYDGKLRFFFNFHHIYENFCLKFYIKLIGHDGEKSYYKKIYQIWQNNNIFITVIQTRRKYGLLMIEYPSTVLDSKIISASYHACMIEIFEQFFRNWSFLTSSLNECGEWMLECWYGSLMMLMFCTNCVCSSN